MELSVDYASFKSNPLKITLLAGETPINDAPSVELINGEYCIPQHYLQFSHTRESVEQLVLNITYSDRYPIFVDEDLGGIYIQVGIIGVDNYETTQPKRKSKVIYGRKWRVESQLPTSEVIQTVFLAIKKAREHEVRELFRVRCQGAVTTPFNNHHDLPLMANHAELFITPDVVHNNASVKNELIQWFSDVTYDRCCISLKNLEQRKNGQWLIDFNIEPSELTSLPELKLIAETLILEKGSLTCNELYYQLMDFFMHLSNRHVDEHFAYQEFTRFSRNNSILTIAEISIILRKKSLEESNRVFLSNMNQANYQTDKTRVPKLYKGKLAEKNKSSFRRYAPLEGILPV